MKQLYIILISLIFSLGAKSQGLPFYYSNGFWNNFNYEQGQGKEVVYYHDSVFYTIIGGGLQVININTGKNQARFHNFYLLSFICADTGNNITIVKNYDSVKIYNYLSDSLINITPPLQGKYIEALARSANYKWIIVDTNIIGRYNGILWTFDTASFNIGNKLLVQNDSTAFVLSGTKIGRWRNRAFTIVAAIPVGTSVSGWDIDTGSNIWLATYEHLLKVTPSGSVSFFSDTAPPFRNSQIVDVLADNNGNIWCESDQWYRFNGQSWSTFFATGTCNMDRATGKLYGDLYGGYSFISINDSEYNDYSTQFMPYSSIHAANNFYVATSEGFFYNGFGFPQIGGFIDSLPFSCNVTCFEKTELPQPFFYSVPVDTLYGTTHGVFSFSQRWSYNYLLPDSNIHFIHQFNNTTYIGTDSGLCIITNDQPIYYNRNNSPLPSDKATAMGLYINYNYTGGLNDTILCIGTDNGFAVKDSAGWHTYDTSTLQINNCYVTDVAGKNPYVYGGDSAFIIATLGQGLFMLNEQGLYSPLNAYNDGFPDDSIYYINTTSYIYNECQPVELFGTAGHGVVYAYYNAIFYADTLATGVAFHRSAIDAEQWISADSGFLLRDFCGGIPRVNKEDTQLRWHQQNDQVQIFLPDSYNGNAKLTLYDIQGRTVDALNVNATAGSPALIPANKLSAGLYILQCTMQGVTLYTKLVYQR